MQKLTTDDRISLRNHILERGLKATHQRVVVYEAILALHGKHPSAEEVYQYLHGANPSISLGTVYKTLDSFVACGLIRKVLSEEDSRRYDNNCQAHNHIYCTNTNEIVDYHDPELENLLADFFKKKQVSNFRIGQISVHISGTKDKPEENINIS